MKADESRRSFKWFAKSIFKCIKTLLFLDKISLSNCENIVPKNVAGHDTYVMTMMMTRVK